ncbi:MAG: phytoene desaturase family protein [Candidatus Xenobiia bacterium LiM19]
MEQVKRDEVTAEILKTKWDAVVIGSGLGGMTAAVGLACRGRKVLVLEQHYIPGGCATSFRRKGFTFEASLHCTPALGEGALINRLLTELGVMDKITPIPMRESILVKSPRGDIPMRADYLDRLKKLFPDEAEGIDKVDEMIDTFNAELGRVTHYTMLPKPVFNLLCRVTAPSIYEYSGTTLGEFLDNTVKSPFLKQLISIQWGYYGLPLDRISTILYLTGWGAFLRSGMYYIKGTSQALSNALVERLEELGGKVLLRQHVEEIEVENGRAVGVISRTVRKDGAGERHRFSAPVIISNANPFDTYGKMLKNGLVPSSLMEGMEKMEKSMSLTAVYVGLDCRLSELTGEDAHSVTYLDSEDIDFSEVFRRKASGEEHGIDGYIDHSALDSDLAPPGKTAMSISRGDFMSGWRGLSEEEYRKRKAEVTEEMLAEMERRVPGFRSHIELVETSTPVTMQRYTANPDGAYNGFAYTPERVGMGVGGVDMQSTVKGLYLSNAWTGALSGGFFGCILNGYTAANTLAHTADWRHQ